MGLLAPRENSTLPGALGEAQGRPPPSPSAASAREGVTVLDQLAAAAHAASPLRQASTGVAALLLALPPTVDFEFDPGVVDSFLVVDADTELPVGSLGPDSPVASPAPVDDTEAASTFLTGDAELAVVSTLRSLSLRPVSSALVLSSTSDDGVPVASSSSFDDVFPGFSAGQDEEHAVVQPPLEVPEVVVTSEAGAPSTPPATAATLAVPTSESAAVPPETQIVVVHDVPLPLHPDRHPGNRHVNHYDPDAPWDYSQDHDFAYFMDRHGDPPNRSYLVKWKAPRLQLSWVWEEELAGYDDLKEHVDKWVEDGRPGTFCRYADDHFGGATASETGRCFMEAIHDACYHLGNPTLITEDHWERFEVEYGREMTYGVKKEAMAEFFKFLERNCVPLDYTTLYKSKVVGSLNSLDDLISFVRREKLARGCYVVCAGQERLDHCFVLVVRLNRGSLMAYDAFDEFESPPCVMEPLRNFQWIDCVKAIYRIAEGPKPKPPKAKRATKCDKKRKIKATAKAKKNAKKRAKKLRQG